MELNFRKLKADEIDCRIQSVTDKGCSMLLYKDARVDMNMLDETVGPLCWKRSHAIIDGNLYCTVSIFDEAKGQWVSKEDVGTESNTEKEKGQASDSFKRACFNWGIGRELYTAPFIWISGGTKTTRAKVASISYDDKGNINKLILVDSHGTPLYTYGVPKEQKKTETPQPKPQPKPIEANVADTPSIALIQACQTIKELHELFSSFSKEDQNKYKQSFTNRKNEINGTPAK